MTPRRTLFVLLLTATLLACTPITTVTDKFAGLVNVRYANISGFDEVNKRTIIKAIDTGDETKIQNLTKAIMKLANNIDINEASFVAREAVLYPKYLANEYKLTWPPNQHNVLVNSGRREKGHCYHFAQDMTAHIAGREYHTLTLQRAVANQGKHDEHNVLTVAARGKGIKDAIILDGWRHSGTLLWMKSTDDAHYRWGKYTPRTH